MADRDNEIGTASQIQGDATQFRSPKITTLNTVAVALAAVLVVVAFVLVGELVAIYSEHGRAYETYSNCDNAATDLMIRSDYLTNESRMYVVTGDRAYLDGYLNEFFVDQNREKAVAVLNEQAPNERAASELNQALSESNELATHELYAMRLTAEAVGTEPLPEQLVFIVLTEEDVLLPNSEKRARAEELVLGEDYRELKSEITADVDECAKELVKGHGQIVHEIEARIGRVTFAVGVIAVLLLVLVAFTAISNYALVMRPMGAHAKDIAQGKPLTIMGSREVKDVSYAYNKLYARVQKQTEHLQHQAETDPLTGALNRGSYDKIMEEGPEDIALVLADVDKFKEVNDTYGHEAGDKVLKRVVRVIEKHFRESDHVCRIGGDEFAIILTGVNPSHRNVIEEKLRAIADDLADTPPDLPEITMSFGVAFSEDLAEGSTLYHEADRMLYASKKSGRNTVSIYDSE